MIVRCPKCSKRYALADKLLLPRGRTVRCVACSHAWHQNPDVVEDLKVNPAVRNLRDVTHPPKLYAGHWPSWVGWSFFLATLFLTVGTVIFSRQTIVTMWPQAERLYGALGLHVDLPGTGLKLVNTELKEQTQNGVLSYVVKGKIINVSEQVKPTPILKISILGAPAPGKCLKVIDEKTCVLDRWQHRLAAPHLLPGEQLYFETAPRPKSPTATSVTIEF